MNYKILTIANKLKSMSLTCHFLLETTITCKNVRILHFILVFPCGGVAQW